MEHDARKIIWLRNASLMASNSSTSGVTFSTIALIPTGNRETKNSSLDSYLL